MGKLKDAYIRKVVAKLCSDWAASDAARDKGLTEPQNVKSFKDISYGDYGEYNLLDVYVPLEQSGKALPVLVNIHGGGYFYGDKNLYRFYAMDMVKDGFAVVNINYRLSPDYKFPCALEDINETLCWIEKNAAEYNFDLSRVYMMGDSAGAQLVSHYAAINSNEQFASFYPFKKHGIKVKGISLACGMYDIISQYRSFSKRGSLGIYIAKMNSKNTPMFDVLGAITSAYPPAFIFTCPNDFLCANAQPMADLINGRGGKASVKIYGTAEMKEIAHVFHCNMRSELGEQARRDQAKFLLNGSI